MGLLINSPLAQYKTNKSFEVDERIENERISTKPEGHAKR